MSSEVLDKIVGGLRLEFNCQPNQVPEQKPTNVLNLTINQLPIVSPITNHLQMMRINAITFNPRSVEATSAFNQADSTSCPVPTNNSANSQPETNLLKAKRKEANRLAQQKIRSNKEKRDKILEQLVKTDLEAFCRIDECLSGTVNPQKMETVVKLINQHKEAIRKKLAEAEKLKTKPIKSTKRKKSSSWKINIFWQIVLPSVILKQYNKTVFFCM